MLDEKTTQRDAGKLPMLNFGLKEEEMGSLVQGAPLSTQAHYKLA